MSVCWLVLTNKLLEGTKLLNLFSTSQFVTFLNHINKTNAIPKFTQEDIKQLQETFKVSEANIQLSVQSLFYIWKQSLKIVLKPTTLHRNLLDDLKFDNEKAEEFVKLWSERTRVDCGDLEKQMKLERVSWELNLETASSLVPTENVPKARLQLGITSLVDKNLTENVTLELNEEQLLKLYNSLENIQIQLDNMQKVV